MKKPAKTIEVKGTAIRTVAKRQADCLTRALLFPAGLLFCAFCGSVSAALRPADVYSRTAGKSARASDPPVTLTPSTA